MKKLVLGHRGYTAKFHENTLESFKKAFEFNADGIETDIRMTKDDIPVLIHDDSILRISGKDMKIKDLTFEELKNIKVFENNNIPKLEEIFEIFPKDSFNNLEIKEVEVVEKTYSLSKKYFNLENILFSSFNVESLIKLRNLDSEVKIGLLIERVMTIEEIIELHKKINFYSLNIPVEITDHFPQEQIDLLLTKLRSANIKIAIWTLNTYEHFKIFEKHADIIITDEVEKIKNWL